MDISLGHVSGRIIINGQVINGDNDFEHKDVVLKAFVDGKEVPIERAAQIKVVIKGDVGTVRTGSGDVKAKTAGHINTASGDVDCGDVNGNINTASGDVKAKNIAGNVSTISGDINTK